MTHHSASYGWCVTGVTCTQQAYEERDAVDVVGIEEFPNRQDILGNIFKRVLGRGIDMESYLAKLAA